MKIISNVFKKMEPKSKHDLAKTIIGAIAAFTVERVVHKTYDSAFHIKKD